MPTSEEINTCLARNLHKLKDETGDLDSNVLHLPSSLKGEKLFLPYVGNGYIGAAIWDDSSFKIKGRVSSFVNES